MPVDNVLIPQGRVNYIITVKGIRNKVKYLRSSKEAIFQHFTQNPEINHNFIDFFHHKVKYEHEIVLSQYKTLQTAMAFLKDQLSIHQELIQLLTPEMLEDVGIFLEDLDKEIGIGKKYTEELNYYVCCAQANNPRIVHKPTLNSIKEEDEELNIEMEDKHEESRPQDLVDTDNDEDNKDTDNDEDNEDDKDGDLTNFVID